MLIEWMRELRDWLTALSPEFAFLLALPFVVAGAGLLRLLWGTKPPDEADRRINSRPPKPRGISSPRG